MAWPKGKPRPKNSGRAKGTPNIATANAREAIARFVDGNAERLQGWLDEIAEEQGAQAAFDCFTSLVEYHVPKLARTDMKVEGNLGVTVKGEKHDDGL